ncbi:dihydroneopterin aldolase [Aestuariibacter halophilus]|uniref:7,8-dihydroneopterin aldolase n=1 Tax=Fluctibacter halophilus TaxID=226011 RepID=A0ABS8G749_9ALTE|nr:dihydroneopterin aldolase [Aestuariibacter halophilus]MCC2616422.1 dihydroneopterin aldolase [Aestuariibacter halophilus]
MDKIILRELQLMALIGVYDFEREAPQALLADVELTVDLQKAQHSDDVADTVDYAALAEWMVNSAASTDFQLLEALAGHLINGILATYPATEVTLELTKPGILDNARAVSVRLTRRAA